MSYIWVTNMMHFLVLLHIHGVFIVVVLHKSLRVDEKEISSQNKIKSVSSLTIFAKPTIESVGESISRVPAGFSMTASCPVMSST